MSIKHKGYSDRVLSISSSKDVHVQKVREVMNMLDKAILQLKVDKCNVACNKIDWLGFELSGSRIAPVNGKVQGISEKLRPTKIKELRLFLGAVNQLNKFYQTLPVFTFLLDQF